MIEKLDVYGTLYDQKKQTEDKINEIIDVVERLVNDSNRRAFVSCESAWPFPEQVSMEKVFEKDLKELGELQKPFGCLPTTKPEKTSGLTFQEALQWYIKGYAIRHLPQCHWIFPGSSQMISFDGLLRLMESNDWERKT